MNDSYYILGVDRSSSINEIKKAYRLLSLKYHPDRNGNSNESKVKFQSINDAYIKLTETSSQLSKSYTSFNRDERYDNALEKELLHKPSAIVKHLIITLEQSYIGCLMPVEIERCVYEGEFKKNEKEVIYIDIPKGIDTNEIIVCPNKGDVSLFNERGDVKIIVNVTPHDTFHRNGLNLTVKRQISLKEALCGFSFFITHLNGKKYKITNTKGDIIHPSFCKTIEDMGMKRNLYSGNLCIYFDILFPTHLTISQMDELEHIL
jgi:DnaJ-class molecular chaperone